MKLTPPFRCRKALIGVILLPFLAVASLTNAQDTVTWNGDGSDSNWSTVTNWVSDGPPVDNDTLIFAGNTQVTSTNDLTVDTIINGIQFTNDGTASELGEFTLSGNQIILNGPITTTAPATGTLTDVIDFDIEMNKGLAVVANGNGTDADHNIIFNGEISGGVKLFTAGDATITLAVANSFTGLRLGDGGAATFDGTTGVKAGTVIAGHSDALGNGLINAFGAQLQAGTSGLVFANEIEVVAAGLRLGGSNDFELSGEINFGGNSTIGSYFAGTTVTISNTIDLSGFNISIEGAGDLDITGEVTGNGNLTKTGTGEVTLSGANDFVGTTTVSGGTLILTDAAIQKDRTYVVDSDGILELFADAATSLPGTINLSGNGTFRKSGSFNMGLSSSTSTVAMGSGALFHVEEAVLNFGSSTPGDWSNNKSDLQVDSGATFRGGGTPIVVDSLIGGGVIEVGGGITIGADDGTGETFSGIIQEETFAGRLNLNESIRNTLTKIGAGTQTLSGANTYTGATTISAGTLLINGDSSGATGDVTVASGATLGGVGTIGGDTVISGTITAGTDGTFGTLAFSGDLTMESGSTWLLDLVNDSTNADRVDVGGALTFSGSQLEIEQLSGTFTEGSSYTIASYASLSGTFSNDVGGIITSGGSSWSINYADGGNFITLTAVPEPTTFLLLLPLLFAGIWMNHRRNQGSANA
ncbi:MAG: autotransporter-associated beta strand repeat-containing protein [Verrucomicrobiales bacterium]|nr:autotransporter-associated beta strand repeat-containing protein [Verrucomicrobiales bacterium]